MTFGSFLQANTRRRARLGRRLALLLSVAAHAGALLAVVFLRMSAPARPAPQPEPIVLRLPRPGRPTVKPAPPPPAPRSPRRPRPAAIVQPPETPQPPPPDPLEPAPDPEPVESDEALASGPAEASAEPPGPPGPISGPPAPAGDSDQALELRDVARGPQVLAQVKPEYPREARWNRLEGMVVVRVVIGTDGRVDRSKTRVVRSIPALDAAAIAAIEQWRFSPAIGHSGQPVRVIIEVPVRFSLR
jgi:protein TonB